MAWFSVKTEGQLYFYLTQEPGQISGITLGYGLDVPGFETRQGLGIFLFTTASRPALGPTQHHIQWVQGAPSLGVKWPGREANHSPPSSAEVKERVELYLHSPNTPSWRGAQLGGAQGQLYIFLLPFYFLRINFTFFPFNC
jgi:hypothetical protein